MKSLNRFILAAGFATLAYLLWKYDPRTVWAEVSMVGWGFALILPFQLMDHLLNALGWRFAFSAEDAPDIPFRRLVKGRIAGDGVNYLTPSATIVGEFVRPGILGDVKTEEIRNTSVLVAKFTQAIAQPLFIFLGMVFVVQGRLNFLQGRQRFLGIAFAVVSMLFLGVVLGLLAKRPSDGERLWQSNGKFGPVREALRRYLRAHPGRFILSMLSFTAGYAWGALEVMLVCHFMGLAMPLTTALAIETLSNVIDSLMFMVPGKVGTQEAGKTAIFHALGLPASQGLAFGLIRHTRELLWASAGFAIYALNQRRNSPQAPRPGSRPLTAKPLARAD